MRTQHNWLVAGGLALALATTVPTMAMAPAGAAAAGDKAGNWDGWYREAIPVADERFMRHLLELEAEDGKKR